MDVCLVCRCVGVMCACRPFFFHPFAEDQHLQSCVRVSEVWGDCGMRVRQRGSELTRTCTWHFVRVMCRTEFDTVSTISR